MSGLFGGAPQGPTRINGVQINQSNLGFPVIVVMGKGKVQQSILWVDGFSNKKINTSGGKGFGGKGGNQYVYSADVLGGLCDGGLSGILGIGDVWSGQSWLRNTSTGELYTIGGTLKYTPANASSMTVDHGVSYTVPISSSYSDVGAPAPTVLTATSTVAFQRVDYVPGQTLDAGTYSVDASNSYYFSLGDTGTAVQVNYSFALRWVSRQQVALIPSGRNVVIAGDLPFTSDDGVIYYGTGPLDGHALTRVTGTPTAAGTYSVDYGSYTVSGSPGSWVVTVNRAASYTFAAADVNQEIRITYKLDNSTALPAGTQTSLTFQLIPGTKTDAPAALLLTNYPGAALGYSGIAKVLYAPMDLGYGAQVQQNVFEVLTADAWGGGIVDCNPVQCILQVLSNPVWGLGAGNVPFPLSAIDNGTGGTWGNGNAGHTGNGALGSFPRPPGRHITEPTASAYFAANNFFISPVIDRQDTAASLISRWLEAGLCAAYISEGLVKLVPYGDTSAVANGATWIAPSGFDAVLDDSCFLSKGANDPVKISSSPWTEAYNKVQVAWNNRANQYAQEITPEEDKAAANRYGSRIEGPQTWDFITTLAAARFAGSMRVKRNVYTRNTYEFSLPFRYGHLEPMGIVSITTSHAWQPSGNNTLQLVNQPARITKIVDNPDGTYDVTCEDYIFGAAQSSAFPKATASGLAAPNQFVDAGNADVVMFVATQRLTGFYQNQLWIGASGQAADWGGCNVWASMDGSKYAQIGTIEATARLGTLHQAFASGSDPDTVNSLVIDLAPNSAGLDSGTTADADQANTLCYVDGELLAYSACVLTGQDQYTADTYIRRGLLGSSVLSHASGAAFLRLDDAVLKFTYDPSWAGQTVHLKFQSFNHFGNAAQDLSSLTAVFLTLPSGFPGSLDPATGHVSNLGGVAAPVVIQGLVNSGSVAPGTYGGSNYQQLTVQPGLASGTGSTSFTAYLNGTALSNSDVTFSLSSGSVGSLSGNTFTPSGTHGGAGILCTLNSNTSVIGGASASW